MAVDVSITTDGGKFYCIILSRCFLFLHICSRGERPFEDRSANGGLRWRSDETSDDEERSPDRTVEVGATPMRGQRRRFARR